MSESAWLVEMVEPDTNKPPCPRWWHPEHGWMWDANKALRFAREQDAADYIRFSRGLHGKATEHVFSASVDTHPKDGDAVAAPLVSGAVPKADAHGEQP